MFIFLILGLSGLIIFFYFLFMLLSNPVFVKKTFSDLDNFSLGVAFFLYFYFALSSLNMLFDYFTNV